VVLRSDPLNGSRIGAAVYAAVGAVVRGKPGRLGKSPTVKTGFDCIFTRLSADHPENPVLPRTKLSRLRTIFPATSAGLWPPWAGKPGGNAMAKKKKTGTTKRAAKPAAEDTTMARKEAILNLKAILVRRRDALRSALAGDLSMLKELSGQEPGDVMDAALDSAQDEISSQLAEVESRELASIEHALERMRDGEYGLCEVCGSKIPMARLNALPYATICITCQREIERTGLSAESLREENAESFSDVDEHEVDVS